MIWNVQLRDKELYFVLGNHDSLADRGDFQIQVSAAKGLGMPYPYYSFDRQGIHFVILDTAETVYSRGEPSRVERLSTEQLVWLGEDLRSHLNPTIILSHVPLSSAFTEQAAYCVENYQEVMEVITNNGNVKMIVSGHDHINRKVVDSYGIKHLIVGPAGYRGSEFNNFSYLVAKVLPSGEILTTSFELKRTF